MDNFIAGNFSEYSHRMGWDDIWRGLDSLWDAEVDNADWDERREITRAERAQQTFIGVLVINAVTQPITVGLVGTLQSLHVSVVGANWLEGIVCGSRHDVLAPLGTVAWATTHKRCECQVAVPRVVEHVTLTARLRNFERSGMTIAVTLPSSGFRGRVTAVLQDGLELHTSVGTLLLPLGSVELITVDGP